VILARPATKTRLPLDLLAGLSISVAECLIWIRQWVGHALQATTARGSVGTINTSEQANVTWTVVLLLVALGLASLAVFLRAPWTAAAQFLVAAVLAVLLLLSLLIDSKGQAPASMQRPSVPYSHCLVVGSPGGISLLTSIPVT
jgi:hypothetical protein